ncbi:hypothetical protein FAZ69_13525 [Trinickia terrae]|uniref:Uncharacterized protein n=1 Tax=Trinickia terrae TaxID=2571161 RepID=A0A4U1I5Y0_9BURK|nr:hypothetical protein [Trinickia terrae]TKC88764.1 hypothetical protein FAZ69_13525 [Trinickia terrae]
MKELFDGIEQFLRTLESELEEKRDSIARIGARLVALMKFVDATLPQLTAVQRQHIERFFLKGIEETMAHIDDIALPEVYQSALLEQVDVLLDSLAQRHVVPRWGISKDGGKR